MGWVKKSETLRLDRGIDPERALALSYAPADRLAALLALLALDETLAGILRTTREPLVGQMRLTWWHAALGALETAPPPAQPVLRALAAEVLPRGVTGRVLAGMIDGWEALLDPAPLDAKRVAAHGRERGVALFAAAGQVLGAGAGDPFEAAGRGWALADLAAHAPPGEVALPRAVALEALEEAGRRRWTRGARALGALALIARLDLALPPGTPPPRGAPRRVARLAWHRLTGR